MMNGLRNNCRLLHQDVPRANRYWQKLKDYCPPVLETSRAVGLNEQFRFYK